MIRDAIVVMILILATAACAAAKVPVCMIIDDPSPFVNAGTTGHPGVIQETPTSFYQKWGQFAQANGVKGKFSVIPICGGVAAIDGSLGEYPGHTQAERLEWIDMIKILFEPNWTITPEVITHLLPWDIVNGGVINNNGQRENDYFASLTVAQKTDYVAYAMQKLKNVGITAGGCTMCWSIPVEQNPDFGHAVLDATARVYGPKNVMIFNDSFAEPAVVYRSPSGYVTVKTPPSVGDLDGNLYAYGTPTPERIAADTNALISADGQSGAFVDRIKTGKPLIFLTHIQSLYTNGRESGYQVYTTAIQRLNQFYGSQIEWMKGEDIVRLVARPSHIGSTDPATEGWDRNFVTGTATAGPAASPAAWNTNCPATNDQAYYCATLTADQIPPDWQLTVTVKAMQAASHEGCFFALGDGSVIWELDVLTTPGASGLYKKKNGGQWTLLSGFPADNSFHTYKVVKYAADSFATVYKDGVSVGTMLRSEMAPYTTRRELQMGGGAWSSPSQSSWSYFVLSPAAAISSLAGTVTFQDFSGDEALAPVRVELRQDGSVYRTDIVALDSNSRYNLSNVLSGTYDALFSSSRCLPKVVSGVIVPPDTPGTCDVTLVNGDMNGDNSVSTSDLSVVLKNLNRTGD